MAKVGGANGRPLVIKRVVEGGHGGHHGGAWKVAYADFVTAMMAFFLLLWLISSASEDTLKGLSEYFSSATVNVGTPGGLGGVLHGLDISSSINIPAPSSTLLIQAAPPFVQTETDGEELSTADGAGDAEGGLSDETFEAERERREKAMFEQAAASIERALAETPELRRFEHNLAIDQTPEGLRIQIVDRDQTAMFPVGSDQMYPHTRELLGVVARAVTALPNRISVRGHTDALPFAPGAAYDNWRLSSDRANATRRALTDLGLRPARVADVTGKGDADPMVADNPHDPRNRRISLVLLNEAGAGRSDASPREDARH